MGKIIQITSAGNDGGMMLYALCDDGRLWEFCIQTGWVEIPLPIPSSNTAHTKDNMPQFSALIKELENAGWLDPGFGHGPETGRLIMLELYEMVRSKQTNFKETL